MENSTFAERQLERQRIQSSDEAITEAIRRINADPVNICGGTAFVPEEILEESCKEQMRLYRELFPHQYALLDEARRQEIEELIGP
ncbi:hypothetical protein EON80_19970 [bacterium]|nr:MAG: hypothetical protein EON80_19970 [bacterium]